MTKEEIFKAFISDEIVVDKKYLTPEQVEKIKFYDTSPNKFIEVLKMLINEKESSEDPSDSMILRKINNFLN